MIDRRRFLIGSAASLTLLGGCSKFQNTPLTVVSYGAGAYQDSHRRAFLEPFTQSTSVAAESASWNAEYGKLRSMVESGHVTWDVVDVTAAILNRGKRDKILAPLTMKLDDRSFLPGTLDPYGVGNVYWATVMAFRAGGAARVPRSWADFYNIREFPGPRALYDDPRGNIEFAMLAAGIPARELYPLTPEKIRTAFDRLTAIRESVRVWWTDGSQPVQLLLTNQVALSSAWSGRIFASAQAAHLLRYGWEGAALELDYWVIPNGCPNPKAAADFITFASRPDRLAAQAKMIGYGPANTAALQQIPEPVLEQLPTYPANFQQSFVVNAAEWEQHEDELRATWVRWKTTGRR